MPRSTQPWVYEVRYVYAIILRETYGMLQLLSYIINHLGKGTVYASRSLRFPVYCYYTMASTAYRHERNFRGTCTQRVDAVS